MIFAYEFCWQIEKNKIHMDTTHTNTNNKLWFRTDLFLM